MQDLIQAALKSSKADYTEIRIEEREATTIAYRGKDLETASAVIDAGGIVRCLCRDGGWGQEGPKTEQRKQCVLHDTRSLRHYKKKE